ncbi:type IV secretory system conjugative DNA transfer family protein [Niastella populi]|uniref:type IV secretory system conjugative DNA transfer family protein n=1 Tax=Niastella populi TaxID=550983 RepID=UPI0013FDD44C|nr:type IV secretion system DNA-binding domain-containing protein [Niastella populi]
MEPKNGTDISLTPVGITDFRGMHRPFYIKDKDRLAHLYCLGKSGVGKSTLLENMAISDIEKGKGICLIDPHGDVAEHLLHYIPSWRTQQVIYFNPAEYAIAFNPLAGILPDQYHLAASGLISTFQKMWDSWGPRLEHILRYCLMTLLEFGQGTLLDIQPLLTNQLYRNNILARVRSKHLLDFWFLEFDKYAPAFRSEAISPILNKLGVFQASAPLRNTVGHQTSSFDIRQIMDEGNMLICNLSKGRLGEDTSALLGSLLVNAIQLGALSRAGQDVETRRPFYLYVDECHSFLSEAYIGVLAECRKYSLSLFLAHQYLEQLDENIRAAIFGNVGTMVCFRVGASDAECLAKEFYPVFTESDLVNLPKYSMYLKMQIDSATSKPFSARTVAIKPYGKSNKEAIIEDTVSRYEIDFKKQENGVEVLSEENIINNFPQKKLF